MKKAEDEGIGIERARKTKEKGAGLLPWRRCSKSELLSAMQKVECAM